MARYGIHDREFNRITSGLLYQVIHSAELVCIEVRDHLIQLHRGALPKLSLALVQVGDPISELVEVGRLLVRVCRVVGFT